MKFESEDAAKNYSISVTAKILHPDEVLRKLDLYNSYYDSAYADTDKAFWRNEINRLTEYINSDKFKNGEYQQGIDELLFELVEWRAAILAVDPKVWTA